MLVQRLEVPVDTRLMFAPQAGPIHPAERYFDLGTIIRAEQHAATPDDSGRLEDLRMVLDCRGIEASELTKSINWPAGEPTMPGTVQFGDHSYPATLQVRPRPKGLRAILWKRD